MRNIFFSFVNTYQLFGYYLGKNPIEIIVDKFFLLDFARIVTKQLISKNEKYFSFLQILNIVSFTNFLHSWWGQIFGRFQWLLRDLRTTSFRGQSFTSLMADLRKNINRVSSFSWCLNVEHFLEGIAPLTQMRRVTNTNILF